MGESQASERIIRDFRPGYDDREDDQHVHWRSLHYF